MEIANFLSMILSIGALCLSVFIVFKRDIRKQKIFAFASLAAVTITAAYSAANLFRWAPIWLIHYEGNTTEITGVVTSMFALMAVFLLERLISVEKASKEIAREREIQDQLRVANEKAQADRLRAEYSDRAKSEFLANMSHELRTPLNAILGFSEVMSSEIFGPLPNDQYRGYAKDINESGDLLLKIINDILDLSKIESGTYTLDETDFDTKQTIDSVVVLTEVRAREKNVALTVIPPNDMLRLRADERTLKQMLLNLLTNAIKFTRSGGTVRISTHHNRDGSFEICVTDTGIGIAEKDMKTVFTEFGQVESAYSRSQQGTGLGLPLTKSLIELHGGTIGLVSEPNVGTTASLKFPPDRVVIGAPTQRAAPKIQLVS